MYHRKGVADIFSALFLVMMIVLVTIGLASYQQGFLVFKDKLNRDVQDYSTAYVVRQKLTECFGREMVDELIEDRECSSGSPLDLEVLENMVIGYEVSVLPHLGCIPQQWSWENPRYDGPPGSEFTFMVPVFNTTSDRNCLARLEVMI